MSNDSEGQYIEREKRELARDSGLAKIAMRAIRKGGVKGAVKEAIAEMKGSGDDTQVATEIKDATGLDVRAETAILERIFRRLGLNAKATITAIKAPEGGAQYTTMVDGVAKLLYPDDNSKEIAAAARIRGVFQQFSDLNDPRGFDTAYSRFTHLAQSGREGWKQERTWSSSHGGFCC